MSERTEFLAPGTLKAPRLKGRAVRVAMGALCLWLVFDVVRLHAGALRNPFFWIWIAVGVWLFPTIVNVGFARDWGNRLRWVLAALAIVGILASYAWLGVPLGRPLWWVIMPWMVYVFGHLGVSFVLSGLFATPGCEMRALPHLFGAWRGRPSREHPCPAFLDRIDRWEAKEA